MNFFARRSPSGQRSDRLGSLTLNLFAILLLMLPAPVLGGPVPIQRERGLPFVRVEVNGKTQFLLLDSGSTHSFLTFEQARSLGLANALGTHGQIYYQIGAEAASLRRSPLVPVEVNFGGHRVQTNMGVFWSGQYGIIGQDILSQFSIQMESDRLVVRLLRS